MISSSPGKARSSRARRRGLRSLTPPLLAAAFSLAFVAAPASASEPGGWRGWWLPPNYAPHGHGMDRLFYWIFWITMVTFVAVWAVMIVFLVKYRHRPEKRKALFTHGNTKLEMVWTLVPAVILIVLALVTKRVWDEYRYAPADEAKRNEMARVLVVGEQFKWSVVYPGPDGKLGRYLIFPKTTDLSWPAQHPDDPAPYSFPAEFPGPAFMPEAKARKVINEYIDQKNYLGKDYTDPAGLDDGYESSKAAAGRDIFLPKDRPIEIHLASKDVIHDFFLPNYRVKLDAVPGMRGLIYFTASPPKNSREYERDSTRTYPLAELKERAKQPHEPDWLLVRVPDPENPGPLPEGVKVEKDATGARYFRETESPDPRRPARKIKKKETLVREGFPVTAELIDALQSAGMTEIKAYQPKYWDLVCEELCGQGHYTMKGRIFVLSKEHYQHGVSNGYQEFQRPFEPAPPPPPAPATAPAVAAGEAAGPQAPAAKP